MSWTEDGFLGGKLKIRQPETGFRAGSDAVLLAAATNATGEQSVLDIGCGVGTASLCVKYRVPDCRVWGVEFQKALAAAARINADQNKLTSDVHFLDGDITQRADFKEYAGPTGKTLLADGFDHVISNPPFYAQGNAQASPSEIKTKAHLEGEADLSFWVGFCAARVKPRGQLTLIHRTDRLPEILHEMGKNCGSLKIIPLWPNGETPAKRVLVQGVKSDKGPARLCPGLVMHEMNGTPTVMSEKILRDGASLADINI